MNNLRYSANVTQQTNRGISIQRRPNGKSRTVSYNNLIRTNFDQISACVSATRFKFKKTTHAHGLDRWYLEDNASAHTHNLQHFLFLSELLHRKQGVQPAIQTLVEFIIFMINHPSLRSSIGVYRKEKKITLPQKKQEIQEEDSFFTTDTPTFQPAAAASDWGDDFDAPQFDDDGL